MKAESNINSSDGQYFLWRSDNAEQHWFPNLQPLAVMKVTNTRWQWLTGLSQCITALIWDRMCHTFSQMKKSWFGTDLSGSPGRTSEHPSKPFRAWQGAVMWWEYSVTDTQKHGVTPMAGSQQLASTDCRQPFHLSMGPFDAHFHVGVNLTRKSKHFNTAVCQKLLTCPNLFFSLCFSRFMYVLSQTKR